MNRKRAEIVELTFVAVASISLCLLILVIIAVLRAAGVPL